MRAAFEAPWQLALATELHFIAPATLRPFRRYVLLQYFMGYILYV
jgi:hypothetical protein